MSLNNRNDLNTTANNRARFFSANTASAPLEDQLNFALRALQNAINNTDPNVIATAPEWLRRARELALRLGVTPPECQTAQGIANLNHA